VKSAIFSVVAASALFVLMGCHNRAEMEVLEPTQAEALKPMQQSWRGVLPCADCEGIETSLFLEKDGTWVMNQHYQGAKAPSTFATYGTWASTADKLVLTATAAGGGGLFPCQRRRAGDARHAGQPHRVTV